MSRGIFHDLIVEEYENSSRKDVDVVGEKRAAFNELMIKANQSLKVSEYECAKEFYNLAINLIENDPYPDEYNLEKNTLFCLKCCLCYSNMQICIQENKVKKSVLSMSEKLIDTLIELYPHTIVPYYLKLLFESRKPSTNNVSTILLCIILQAKLKDENVQEEPFFQELLPNLQEIMTFQQTILTKSLTSMNSSDIGSLLKFNKKIITSRNMAVQTSKLRSVNKHLQTNLKTFRNTEVQVNLEVQEFKKKLSDAELKLRENVATNNKKLKEMQNKVDALVKENQSIKEQLLKECQSHNNELIVLRRNLEICEEEKAAEVQKNEKLQKFILDLVEERYNMRKHLQESLREKGTFMLTYLGDLLLYLYQNSIPDHSSVQNEIQYWQLQMMANNRNMEILMVAYKTDKTKLIQSSCSDTNLSTVFKNWPEVAQCQRDCDSVIFKSLPLVLRKKSELEAQLLEMRNNFKGFLNYAQLQCEPQPWITVGGSLPTHIIRPQYATVIPFAPPLTSFSFFRSANTSHNFMGASNVTSAHPEPLPAIQTVPIQMTTQQSDGKRKKRKDGKSSSAEPTSSPSNTSAFSKLKNCSGNDLEIIAIPGPSQSSVVNIKFDLVSNDEVPKPDSITKYSDDKILFNYISDNCPGYTEENITLAMLKVLDKYGGSFENIPRQQILNNTKSLLSSPLLFDDISEQCCTICFEEHSKGPLHTLSCRHVYHRKCIKMWLKKSGCCPICRKPSKFS